MGENIGELRIQDKKRWGGLRSSSAALGSIDILEQELVIVRDNNPDAKSTAKEEKEKTPSKRRESSMHQFTGIL